MTATAPSSLATVRQRVRQSARAGVSGGLHRLEFQAMSTVCRVNCRAGAAQQAQAFQAAVLDWVAWFEAQYSRFIPDSLIGRINAAAGQHWVEVDAETETILNLCQEMVFFTRGVFDPTALPLIQLWNWKARPAVVPTAAAVAAAQELAGWRKVQRRPSAIFLPQAGMSLDLGGIGKEYAVDRVMDLAQQHGLADVLVDFGQDVRVAGEPPERGAWHIGLEDPKSPGKCWTSLAVNRHGVATSGDYLRHFTAGGRRYGHIIDPRDGSPVNNGCLAVSVIAPNCTLAGILATSAFVLGPREGLNLISLCPGVEGAIISETSRTLTPNFYAYAIQ
jgi:thiamine biosynthesis lipoprotein